MGATPHEACMRQPVCHLETEAEYFHRLDAELIDSMRERAACRERRLRLAIASGINDPTILETLKRLGYDHTTVMLLPLVPLVQVAWANGFVSTTERDRIIAVASMRGVRANTPAYDCLVAWLDQRPPDEFFQGSLSAISKICGSLPPIEQKAYREALLLGCREVAIASCGHFGWGSGICAAKRKLIGEISKGLEPNQQVSA